MGYVLASIGSTVRRLSHYRPMSSSPGMIHRNRNRSPHRISESRYEHSSSPRPELTVLLVFLLRYLRGVLFDSAAQIMRDKGTSEISGPEWKSHMTPTSIANPFLLCLHRSFESVSLPATLHEPIGAETQPALIRGCPGLYALRSRPDKVIGPFQQTLTLFDGQLTEFPELTELDSLRWWGKRGSRHAECFELS